MTRALATALVALCLPACATSDMPPAAHAAGARPIAAAPRTVTKTAPRSASPAEQPPAPRAERRDGQILEDRYKNGHALAVYRGEATYYGEAFRGRRTASGEPFDPTEFTAAHRSLPFGTVVRVVCPKSRRAVYVRINDCGQFGSRRRIIDLSPAAAARLDIVRLGVADVRVEVVAFGKKRKH